MADAVSRTVVRAQNGLGSPCRPDQRFLVVAFFFVAFTTRLVVFDATLDAAFTVAAGALGIGAAAIGVSTAPAGSSAVSQMRPMRKHRLSFGSFGLMRNSSTVPPHGFPVFFPFPASTPWNTAAGSSRRTATMCSFGYDAIELVG